MDNHLEHNLRDYETFRRIMELGTMTSAADYLGIPQPALSRTIASLEKKIGKKLFDRIEGRLVPTNDAEFLYSRLAETFGALELINSHSWMSDSRSTIKLVANPTFSSTFMPRTIASFLKSYPDVKFSIEETTDSNVQRLVAKKHADLGLRFAKSSIEPGLTNQPIAKSRSVCIFPRGHPLESLKVVTPSALSGIPQAIMSARFTFRTAIETAFRDANAELNIAAECGSFALVTEFVLRNFGVGIINPFPITQAYSEHLSVRPFEPGFTRFAVFSHRGINSLSKIARTFIDFSRSQIIENIYIETANNRLQTFEDNLAL